MQSHVAENATTTAAGSVVVIQGVSTSMKNTSSMLSSSVEQILTGDFVLHGSDITTLAGSVFLIVNVWLGLRRWQHDKKKEQCELKFVDTSNLNVNQKVLPRKSN